MASFLKIVAPCLTKRVVAGRRSPSGHPVLDRIGNFLADIRQLQEFLPAQNVFGLFGQPSVFCCFISKIVVKKSWPAPQVVNRVSSTPCPLAFAESGWGS
jgi:hypothetical protein